MKIEEITNSVSSIDGIGPAAESKLAKLGIFSVSDLLRYYPRDYEDKTKRIFLKDWSSAKVNTIARVIKHSWIGYGKMRTLKIHINDGSGNATLVAFNRAFLEKSLPEGSVIYLSGTFVYKYNEIQSSSFDAVRLADYPENTELSTIALPENGIVPVYKLTEGLQGKNLRKYIQNAIKLYASGIDNNIPEQFIKKHKLFSKSKAICQIHFPDDYTSLETAKNTIKYEELFNFECTMAKRLFLHKGTFSSAESEKEPVLIQDFRQSLCPLQEKLLDSLSFEPTPDQKKVIMQMNNDIDRGFKERNDILLEQSKDSNKKPYTMQRLLQADVGAGKTLTAFFACLRVINWGGQCAFMAPTELLAIQHAENASKLLGNLGINVAFLSGNVKSSGRRLLLKEIESGTVKLLIGTHALFSKDVVYKDLQLAIIDEQHRFGVLQRNQILEKGKKSAAGNFSPHLLMMSATPIPQSLALTVFGDLDISEIKTMPAGRKAIQTFLTVMGHEMNVYNAVSQELAAGHQAYFVYPRIEEGEQVSENNDNSLKSAEDMYAYLSQKIFPSYKVALLHSKIEDEESRKILEDFSLGKIQILVATTVVEVGVDVANATCMVIEHADRFGLAELHQLRGRVGRGSAQSYCFLIYGKNISKTGIERIKVIRNSTDGFYIAEQDLKLRGPGELQGLVQSGNLNLGLADFVQDKELLNKARSDAFEFMQHKIQDSDF